MARIAILGASGKLGDLLIGRALELGHQVQALTRDPRRIKRTNERLTVIQGDAETGEGLDAVVERCQFAVSALGSATPTIERCIAQLVRSLESIKRLERFVLISRLGVGDSRGQAAKVSGLLQSRLPVLLPPIYRDLGAAEGLVRVSRLPYTILRATRLTDDRPSGTAVWTRPSDPPPHRISRADLAHFVLDGLSDPGLLRQEITVGSR